MKYVLFGFLVQKLQEFQIQLVDDHLKPIWEDDGKVVNPLGLSMCL